MKLYNIDHSPYATRVRMQIRKKGLAVDILPPPVPLRTAQFNARFPLGKLPVLELDNGVQIADSAVIMDYLEDIYPASPLRPTQALACAQSQLLLRCADTYLGPGALFPLFAKLGAAEDSAPLIAALHVELARLERLLASLPPFAQRSVQLGDIALAPALDYVLLVAPIFGEKEVLAAYPQIQAWWQWVREDAVVDSTLKEMEAAFRAFAAAKK